MTVRKVEGSEPGPSRSERLAFVQRDLALDVTLATSLDETLETCLQAALAAAEMDAGGIYLVDSEPGGLSLACHTGLSAEFIAQTAQYGPDDPHTRLVMDGRSHYASHTEVARQVEAIPTVERFSAIAVVPLWFGDAPVGCLNVVSRSRDDVPGWARTALETVAGQAAHSIERFRAQERSRLREANLGSLFDAVRDMLFVMDLEGRILAVNRAVTASLGFSLEELVGSGLDRVHPPERAGDVQMVAAEMIAGTRERCDIPLLTASGASIPVETCVSHGTWYGKPALYGISRDITERKREEEKRLQLERSLQQAQKMESLGVLAGGVAHHFNNALMAIVGNTEIAQGEVPPDSEVADCLAEISDASRQAASLCQQMLTYAGGGTFVPEEIDLVALLRDMEPLLATAVPAHVTFEATLPDTLPPVNADRRRLKQAVTNLVLNAGESFGGQRSGRVSLSAGVEAISSVLSATLAHGAPLPRGLYLYFEVSDDGRGLDEESLDRLFDPFYTPRFAGQGLGLAATQGIIRGHGGGLRVASAPGQGTTVRALLPATPR